MTHQERRLNPEAAREYLLAPIKPVLDRAGEIAGEYSNGFVYTEHILLSVVQVLDEETLRILSDFDTSPEQIATFILFQLTPQDKRDGQGIKYTERAKKALELSLEASRIDHKDQISRKHLLLGLAREGQGGAAGFLEVFGILPEDLALIVNENTRPAHRVKMEIRKVLREVDAIQRNPRLEATPEEYFTLADGIREARKEFFSGIRARFNG